MRIPLCVICCFTLAAFNICSLCLTFVNLINMCLGRILPWVYPVWDSLGFLDLGDYFLPHFREVFNYYLLKYFLMAFLFVLFLGLLLLLLLLLSHFSHVRLWVTP